MGRFDIEKFKYLNKEHFRILTAVNEMLKCVK